MDQENRDEKNVEEEKQCRICFESDGKLISPCLCNGFSKYIHPECLATWRNSSQGNHFVHEGNPNQSYYRCNVCHYRYRYHRLWWGKFLESNWVRSILTCALMGGAIFCTGQFSAHITNVVYAWFTHGDTSLSPHRLQILFHGLAWIGVPGLFMCVHDLVRGVGEGPFRGSTIRIPNISFPTYNYPVPAQEQMSGVTPEEKEEKKEVVPKNKKSAIVKYQPPSASVWILVTVGCARVFYRVFQGIRDYTTRICVSAQALVENI